MQKLEFKVNTDVYLGQMQRQLAASIADLRNTLRAIEDGSFAQRAVTPRPDTVVHFRLDSVVSPDNNAVAHACTSCFLTFVRSLITFIDRMVAVKRLLGQTIEIPPTISNAEELQQFVANHFEKTYEAVARDTGLSNPAKLTELGLSSDFAKKATLSYFGVRRCLEHHSGVPDRDINLWYFKPTILAGEEEITHVPYVTKEATQVSFDHVSKTCSAGSNIQLTEYDVEQVVFTIQSVIGPEIRKTVVAS
jgi:hypothetical protein